MQCGSSTRSTSGGSRSRAIRSARRPTRSSLVVGLLGNDECNAMQWNAMPWRTEEVKNESNRIEPKRTTRNTTQHNMVQHDATRFHTMECMSCHTMQCNAVQCSACRNERSGRGRGFGRRRGRKPDCRNSNAKRMQMQCKTKQNRTVPMDGWNPRNQKPDRNERVSVDDRMQNIVLHCISVQYVEEYERPTGMLVRPGNPLCLSLLYYTLSICIYATPRSPSRRGTHERNGP
mmetsp:Transcript_14114/g.28688  ORF Transcript_14114/g.28688 Transcript_14114/m.28688 type:complete len:232 (+) Transcript_14114:128-823(+)